MKVLNLIGQGFAAEIALNQIQDWSSNSGVTKSSSWPDISAIVRRAEIKRL